MKTKLLFALLGITFLMMATLLYSQYQSHFPVTLPGNCVVFTHPSFGLVEVKVLNLSIPRGVNLVEVQSPKQLSGLVTQVRNSTIRAHGYIVTECQ